MLVNAVRYTQSQEWSQPQSMSLEILRKCWRLLSRSVGSLYGEDMTFSFNISLYLLLMTIADFWIVYNSAGSAVAAKLSMLMNHSLYVCHCAVSMCDLLICNSQRVP